MMHETLAGATAAYGATFDLAIEDVCGVTYNDPALVEETLPSIRAVVGDTHVASPRPQMAGEDFSAYQQQVPGFFYFLGIANKAKGITASWHTPEYDIDEDALVIGVDVMSNVLLDYLERHAAR
jgi:amidohydrolase